MQAQLFDVFQPGQTELDGVPALFPILQPVYDRMLPSVAQALLPYPHTAMTIRDEIENQGSSIYPFVSVKAEHRFSKGLWALLSYTNSNNHQFPTLWKYLRDHTFSPFERQRIDHSLSKTFPKH